MTNPIKPTLKTEALPLLLIIFSWILAGYFYTHFPDQVAGHWNFQGQVDRYAGKTEGAIAVPILLAGMYLLFLALPFIDPKKERYGEFAKVYHFFKNAMISLLFLVYCLTGAFNLGYPVNIGILIPLLIGLLMILIGNYMGKIKNNWFVGIKTPWTLSSENVWNKTHRLGGWMFIIFGLIMIISPFLSEFWGLSLFAAGIFLVVVVPMAYSYILYRQEQKDKK